MKLFSFFLIAYPLLLFSKSLTQYDFAFQGRAFFDNPQGTESLNQSLQGNFSHKLKNSSWKSVFEVYFQVDNKDEDRSYYYPKDLYLSYEKNSTYIKTGYQVFNWSSNEAFQPVDVLNSRNLESQVQNSSRIGELSLSIKQLLGSNSSIELIYMPSFTTPITAEEKSSFGPMLNINDPLFLKNNKIDDNKWNHQGALKISTSAWESDFSLIYINHIDRQNPILNYSGKTITPIYYRKEQLSFSSQSIFDKWVFKTEYSFINIDSDITKNSLYTKKDHSIGAIGLERSFAISTHTFTLLLEIQKYFGLKDSYLKGFFFQDDALIGLRYAFNDIDSKEIFVSQISDLEYFNQFFYYITYKQRVFESWNIETGLHLVDSKVENQYVGLNPIDHSDHIFFNLKKYF